MIDKKFENIEKGMSVKKKILRVRRSLGVVGLVASFMMSFYTTIFATNPSTISALSRVYNERFTPGVEAQQLGDSGVLDDTFNDTAGSIGSINLSAQSLSVFGSQATAVVALPDGDFLVTLSYPNYATRLAKYNSEGMLQTLYNSPNGFISLLYSMAQTMILDVQGRALVGGGDDTTAGTSGWLTRVDANGTSQISFATNSAWQFVGGLAEQSTGKIIAVGSNNANAQIARYNLDGTLDVTFGNNGYTILNGSNGLPTSTSGIYSVVVDAQDRIYVPYVDGSGMVWVVRFLPTGIADSTWFTSFYAVITIPSHPYVLGQFNETSSTQGTFTSNSSMIAHSGIAYLSVAAGGTPIYTGTFVNSGGSRTGTFTSNSPFITNTVAIEPLNGATPSSVRMAIDSQNNLIFAAQVGENIKAWGIQAADGAPSTIDLFNSSTISSDTFNLSSLITTNDGSILIGGCDITTNQQVVIKLQGVGQQHPGHLDTTFNGTGYNLFQTAIGGSVSQANIFDLCLSPDGRIYAAGFEQATAPLHYPLISRLYNTLYDSQVAQSPETVEQGIQDLTFGQDATQTYQGVVSPFLGQYRGNLQQQATEVIEIGFAMQATPYTGVGDLLVGGNGFTNTSSVTSMMLTWLTPAGLLDTNFNAGSGQLALINEVTNPEYLNAIAQGSSGAIYVAGGVPGIGAILRKYSNAGTTGWTSGAADWSVLEQSGAGFQQGLGVALQGANLVLLFESTGYIFGYDPTTGNLADGTLGAPTFGDAGSGSINSNSYGLSMGSLSGGVINAAGDIFVAYAGISGYVDVAAFISNGSGLISEFGTNGVISNIFDGADQTVNIAASNKGDLLVCGANHNFIDIARFDGVTGQIDTTFNGSGILSVPLSYALISQIQGVSDGSIMIIGTKNHQQFMMRITEAGALDTTFNSQGSTPGIEFIQVGGTDATAYANVATALTIQSTTDNVGNIILAGYEQATSADATPMITRSFGQPDTTAVPNYSPNDQYPGTLDLSLNGTGCQDLSTLIAHGTANLVFAYPAGNTYEGMLLIAIDNGTTTIIARVDETYMTLDTNFGQSRGFANGRYTVSPNRRRATTLSIDANNNILIGGLTDAAGDILPWAQQITPDGTSAISFDIPSYFTQVNAIGQQKSGRYIIAGQNIYTQNQILAFQDKLVGSNSMLELDLTFNPLATNAVVGSFVVQSVSGGLYTLAIDTDDTIITACTNGTVIIIEKILADGAGYDLNFGSNGIVTTTLGVNGGNTVRVAIDNSHNIIVACATVFNSSSNAVAVARFDTLGGTTNAFTGAGVVDGVQNVVIASSNSTTFTTLLETATQQTILLGYSSDPSNLLYAVRLDATGALDATWNPSAVYPDVPGVLSYDVASASIMQNAWIGISGNIWVAATNQGEINIPLLIEIVGDTYVQGVMQDPLAALAGTLDYTLSPFGALNLIDQLGIELGRPKKLSILADNQSMLIASNLNGTTQVTKMNPILALDVANFNHNGQTPGYVTIAQAQIVNDMFVANAAHDTGTIYVTGTNNGSMWAATVHADGNTVTSLIAANSLVVGNAIRQTKNRSVLVAGYAGSTGIIAAFNADMTALDTSFGNGGYYTTNYNSEISAMTLDDNGLIYIAYKNYNTQTLTVQRILANGSGIDADFLSEARSCYSEYIALALDQTNNQLVTVSLYNDAVSGPTHNAMYVRRYNTSSLASTGGVDVGIEGESFKLSNLFIDTDQNIYVVAYTSADTYTTNIARFVSENIDNVPRAIRLDESNYAVYPVEPFAPTPGIANVVAGALTRSFTRLNGVNFMIGAGVLDADGRVYVIGQDGNSVPYIARFFGDNYYTQVSQAIPLVESGPGDFDPTYGIDGVAQTYAGGLSVGQQARAILPVRTGTNVMTIIENSDGSQAWTVQLLSNGTNDPSYGSGQGIEIVKLSGNEIVQGMVFDGAGNSIVFGTNDAVGGFVKNILPTGAMNTSFGGFTGQASTTNYPDGTAYIPSLAIVNAVAQLSNGNYIFAGDHNGVGMIGMLSSTGALIPFGSAASGFFTIGMNVTSVSIDSDDNIYASFGYQNGSQINASVVELNLNETNLYVTSFGNNNTGVVQDVISNIDAVANIRLVLDGAGKIVVAASGQGSPGSVQVIRLLSTGLVDQSFAPLTIEFAANTSAFVLSLIALQNATPGLSGQYLISGFQYDPVVTNNNDYEFVACVTPGGILDVTFGALQTTPGLVLMQVLSGSNTIRNIWGMGVQDDGQILLAGSSDAQSSLYVPLTMRLDGYFGLKPIKQFLGGAPVNPSVLNPFFNGTGISTTTPITNLIDGGDTVIDSQGRAVLGGLISASRTISNQFVVARFLTNGQLDSSFNGNGITISTITNNVISGFFVAVTGEHDDIIIGGINSNNQFILVKFSGIDGSAITDGFGVSGIAESPVITNLVNSESVIIDYLGNILIGGRTSDGQLVIARFTSAGAVDINFNNGAVGGMPQGVASTGVVSGLVDGGFVTTDISVTDADNSVYIGGSTSTTLVAAKFDGTGTIVSGYGNAGIALTAVISGLIGNGSVALDSLKNIIVGGYTLNKMFVVARFRTAGDFDPSFGNNGIAFSNSLSSLTSIGDINVDSIDEILIGGISVAYDGISKSMIVARFTNSGAIDTSFTSTGIATTGIISQLVLGGFVATNVFDNIFVGGFTSSSELVVAQMFSGQEIFVMDPAALSQSDYKKINYGGNFEFFEKYLALNLFARVIVSDHAREVTLSSVQDIINNYIQVYQNQPGWNLVLHIYRIYQQLEAEQAILVTNFASSATQINNFFHHLYDRIGLVTGHFIAG